MPQQNEVIDIEDEGSGSLSGPGDSVLRVFKAEELLHVAEADLQWPAQSEGFEDLRRLQGEVGGEEAVVAAAAPGVADHQIRSSLGPALEYHSASMDLYQTFTLRP